MVRDTSRLCFEQIKIKGLVSKKRLEVLEAILLTAPCTSSEALISIQSRTGVISQGRARFGELRDLGVIYERQNRICSVTGKTVIEWDLTDKLPVKVKKKKGRPENLKKCIEYLIEGMDLRYWDTISRQMLVNLKNNKYASKKKRV